MIPPPFDYQAPRNLQEAVKLLADNPDAKILSGGHSLIPMMKFRQVEPPLLVDINRLEGLAFIREEGDWLEIGALCRESDLENSQLVRERYPLLADTAAVIADPLVRNRATVGGNLAHADPANDHPATMIAYGAEIVATGPDGEKTFPARSFFQGMFETALGASEILTRIRIPAAQPGDGGAYLKLERKVGDYATSAVAVQLHLEERDGQPVVGSVGIGLTNAGMTPIRAEEAETSLIGQPLSADNLKKAAGLAAGAADPVADHRGSVDYKRSLIRTFTVRALQKAADRSKGDGS